MDYNIDIYVIDEDLNVYYPAPTICKREYNLIMNMIGEYRFPDRTRISKIRKF